MSTSRIYEPIYTVKNLYNLYYIIYIYIGHSGRDRVKRLLRVRER